MDPDEGDVESCLGATAGSSGSRLDLQLQDAVRLKAEGNAFYQEKNVRAAIGRYHRALLVLRSLDPEVTSALQGFGSQLPKLNPEQEELLRNTQVDCYNNLAGNIGSTVVEHKVMVNVYIQKYGSDLTTCNLFSCFAACLLQRDVVNYARVLEYSLKVLHRRAGNTKALYRAGVASLQLGDAQTARQYLLQASKSTPNGKTTYLLFN